MLFPCRRSQRLAQRGCLRRWPYSRFSCGHNFHRAALTLEGVHAGKNCSMFCIPCCSVPCEVHTEAFILFLTGAMLLLKSLLESLRFFCDNLLNVSKLLRTPRNNQFIHV